MLPIWLTIIVTLVTIEAKFINNPFEGFRHKEPHWNFDLDNVHYKLCTYSREDAEKCEYTVEVARNNKIDLSLKCVQRNSLEECLLAVKKYGADMVLITSHHYEEARNAGLKPFIYERKSEESRYIAVAPNDIKLVAINEAPIIVDQSDSRAFHAAVFFNWRREHDICKFFNAASDGDYVKIVNSAEYQPNENEILLCPDRTYAFVEDYKKCNFESGLQLAVFMRKSTSLYEAFNVRRKVFDTLLEKFNHQFDIFDFFNTFNGQDNIILNNDAISFDLQASYQNGITEKVFSHLHCDAGFFHDASQLE